MDQDSERKFSALAADMAILHQNMLGILSEQNSEGYQLTCFSVQCDNDKASDRSTASMVFSRNIMGQEPQKLSYAIAADLAILHTEMQKIISERNSDGYLLTYFFVQCDDNKTSHPSTALMAFSRNIVDQEPQKLRYTTADDMAILQMEMQKIISEQNSEGYQLTRFFVQCDEKKTSCRSTALMAFSRK